MPSEDVGYRPMGRPAHAVEMVINATIILAAAVPVQLATGNEYVGIAAGIATVTLCNVAYWRLVRGVPLHQVYHGLKPWVDTSDTSNDSGGSDTGGDADDA